MYETADTNLRTEAEKALIQFAESPDCLNKCQLLLERGNVRFIIFAYKLKQDKHQLKYSKNVPLLATRTSGNSVAARKLG